MRFTFLGTGTSAGIPTIGCDCHVCTSDDPRDTRLRAGAALEFLDAAGKPRTILIDCTPDLRQQALKHRLMRCDAVLFTHNHVDHTFGVDELRRFNAIQNAPIDIFAEQHTMDHLRRVYTHIFDAHRNINPSFVATLIPRLLIPAEPIELYGLIITPIRLLHGKLPILGFRFDLAPHNPAKFAANFLPLAYCTDVSAIPPESWRAFRGTRTLILDALRERHHPTHFTIDQAIHAAQNINAQHTFFTHMAHEVHHATVDAKLPQGIRLAYDGLTLE